MNLEPDSVVLEKILFCIEQRVNRRLWQDVIVTAGGDDFIAEDIVIRMEKMMLAEKVGESCADVPVSVPDSWWQMLKRDHFPEWFKRRWPVRWNDQHWIRIQWDELAVFPEHNIKTPLDQRGGTVLPYYRQKEPDA